MIVNMDIGSVIRKARKKKGLTQNDFATWCEITQTYLSQIESNTKAPNISTLKKISENLDIPLPILFFLSMTEDDIDPAKRDAYKMLGPSVNSLINEFFTV